MWSRRAASLVGPRASGGRPQAANSAFGAWGRGPRPEARGPSCAGLAALIVIAAWSGACRQDMHDQPKYKPLRASEFFADARSERPIVAGTVPRGFLRDDDHLYTGKLNGQDVTTFPFPIDEQMMRRGRERFDIYCSPCHGRTGNGDGMIVRRGYRRPPSYHDERLRQSPVGHFFDVMTNGFGAMPDYATQIAVEDRWAIIAYIRALQLSQHAAAADVPPDARAALSQPSSPSAPAPAGGAPR